MACTPTAINTPLNAVSTPILTYLPSCKKGIADKFTGLDYYCSTHLDCLNLCATLSVSLRVAVLSKQ